MESKIKLARLRMKSRDFDRMNGIYRMLFMIEPVLGFGAEGGYTFFLCVL